MISHFTDCGKVKSRREEDKMFKVFNFDYELYKEKILPYIKDNSITENPARVGGSMLYILKNSIINVGINLDKPEPTMSVAINPEIENNKKTIEDLEKLVKGEELN